MRNGKDKFLTIAYDVNGLEQYDGMLENEIRMIFFFFFDLVSFPHLILNVEGLILQNIK